MTQRFTALFRKRSATVRGNPSSVYRDTIDVLP